MRILILTGSFKGRASRVGDLLAARFRELGATALRSGMDDVDEAEIARCDGLVVCTSTFGDGGAPPNGQALLERLSRSWPELAGKRFGVVGLGDSSFRNTYNAASAAFEAALRDRGADAPLERLLLDAASTRPCEPDVHSWAVRWHQALSRASDDV